MGGKDGSGRPGVGRLDATPDAPTFVRLAGCQMWVAPGCSAFTGATIVI
jgi:hypothetical protein